MSRIILLDCETSGLNPEIHEILEIGALKVDTGEDFSVKIIPQRMHEMDAAAVKLNGYSPELWISALPLSDALLSLNEFVGEDSRMMAYNVSFDRMFLERAYRSVDIEYPFHYHHFDLLTLAWYRLHEGSPLSLKSVCTQLKIEREPDTHSALEGVRASYRVFKRLTERV